MSNLDQFKPASLAHLPHKFHALLIGIDAYRHVNPLSGAVRDMNAMKDFLTHAFDAPPDIRTLTDLEATHDNIILKIRELGNDPAIEHGDAILIYYAGHGTPMPPPEGWPGYSEIHPDTAAWHDEHDIQGIVAVDGKVDRRELVHIAGGTETREQKVYGVTGVVLDRTLAALLRDLSQSKGSNITVILDCCHSGSGTRNTVSGIAPRRVLFEDPSGRRVTVASDYDEHTWNGYISRGAFVNYEHREAGLHSHVLLAACSAKQTANDGGSFTQALIPYLRQRQLHALSYVTLIEEIGKVRGGLYPQDPICEGDNKESMLFDVKEVQFGRLTFDARRTGKDKTMKLYAGEILGIVEGTEFAVYTSRVLSVREVLVGRFIAVPRIGAMTCKLKPIGDVDWGLLGNANAVASPTSPSSDVFHISTIGDVTAKIMKLAVDTDLVVGKDSESPEDRYGRRQLSVRADAGAGKFIAKATEDGSLVRFSCATFPELRDLGITTWSVLYPVPADPPAVRRVLRAAAHFFKYLEHVPRVAAHQRSLVLDNVNVYLSELRETGDVELVNGTIVARAEAVPIELKRLSGSADPGMYASVEVKAIEVGDDPEDAIKYGVEISNKLSGNQFFVWMFLFDYSTLEIRQYYQPRTTSRTTSVDPPLPRNTFKPADGPKKVALNFRDGGGDALQFQLNRGQSRDLGCLRIFISTKNDGGGLSSIQQHSPFKKEDGKVRSTGRKRRVDPVISSSSDGLSEVDIWDVITIPLVQVAAVLD